jgi:hypothetical protein
MENDVSQFGSGEFQAGEGGGVAVLERPAQGPSRNGREGRAKNGRFAKGWKGGPGNPHAIRVNKLRSVLLREITTDRWRIVVDQLITKAERGDLDAIKMLMDRMLGKATQAIELSGPDGGPVRSETAHTFDHLAFFRQFQDFAAGKLGRHGAPELPEVRGEVLEALPGPAGSAAAGLDGLEELAGSEAQDMADAGQG